MTRRFERERERKKWDVVLDESKSCPLLEQSKTGNGMERGGGRRSWKSSATRKRNFLLFPRGATFPRAPRYSPSSCNSMNCAVSSPRVADFHVSRWFRERGVSRQKGDWFRWMNNGWASHSQAHRPCRHLSQKKARRERRFRFFPLPESGGRHFGRRWSVFLRNLNFAPSWLPRSKQTRVEKEMLLCE